MPTVEHSTLSGSELHDPLYIAFSGVIDDISTADTIYIPMPYAGTVKRITTVLGGAIATANATITVKNSAAASMGPSLSRSLVLLQVTLTTSTLRRTTLSLPTTTSPLRLMGLRPTLSSCMSQLPWSLANGKVHSPRNRAEDTFGYGR